MQRLAGFRQYAWRCESRSLPNASPQRHNTHTHTRFFYSQTQAHTACCCFLLIHSSSSSTIYSGLCCSRSKQATPATCCCRPCLISVSAAKTPISTVQRSCTMKADHLTKKKGKKTMSALVHTLRPSLSS